MRRRQVAVLGALAAGGRRLLLRRRDRAGQRVDPLGGAVLVVALTPGKGPTVAGEITWQVATGLPVESTSRSTARHLEPEEGSLPVRRDPGRPRPGGACGRLARSHSHCYPMKGRPREIVGYGQRREYCCHLLGRLDR